MIMRSGASVTQLFAFSSDPRGARTSRFDIRLFVVMLVPVSARVPVLIG